MSIEIEKQNAPQGIVIRKKSLICNLTFHLGSSVSPSATAIPLDFSAERRICTAGVRLNGQTTRPRRHVRITVQVKEEGKS